MERIVHDLLGRGLLSMANVVTRGVEVSHLGRRNLNWGVCFLDGSGGIFVKRPRSADASRASVAREARFYAHCAKHGVLTDLLPTLLEFDPESHAMYLAWIPSEMSLRAHYEAASPHLEALGRAIGSALAAVRDATPHCAALLDDLPSMNAPSVLTLHKPSPAAMAFLSRGNMDLLRILQGAPSTCSALDLLHDGWRQDDLIHSDVKADNVLVIDGARPRVAFVDWEGVRRGDGAWDLAGAFHDVLIAWLHSMTVTDDTPEEYVLQATLPLARLRPFAYGIWEEVRPSLPPGQSLCFLERAIRFTGARLIQAAYEASASAVRLTKDTIAILQLAANILADPADASLTLFGLDCARPDAPR